MHKNERTCVSLKGDISKPRFLGEMVRMYPKSMCIKCPSLSNNILPLCLQEMSLERSQNEQNTPVLHLKEVTGEAVGSARVHQIPLRLKERLACRWTEHVLKVVQQSAIAAMLFDLQNERFYDAKQREICT